MATGARSVISYDERRADSMIDSNVEERQGAHLRIARVDLRALQFARKIDVTHLGLRIELVHFPAPLAVSVAGLLHTAERKVCFRSNGWSVDVRDAVVQLVQCAERERHVARIERRRE